MFTKPWPTIRSLIFCAAALAAAGRLAHAQDAGKSKDEALDSLIEKLGAPRDGDQSRTVKAPAGSTNQKRSANGRDQTTAAKTNDVKAGKDGAPRKAGSDKLAPKDQAVDDLLQKLGETRDEPTREERPSGPARKDEAKGQGQQSKPGGVKLGEKEKAIDERLEEYAGRRKKRPNDDGERKGPIGEVIKQMREVEKRLGKPDAGEDTRNEQKQIVKRIDTLIEQARQSGSGMGQLLLRRVRQAGQQQGRQPGDEQGAMAQGARPMKPAKPTSKHSTAGGKDIWGHLPPELREVMDNSFKEIALSSKSELIKQYFLSINKGKLVREE
jgi:hypothetical protein